MSTFGELFEPGTRTAWEDWDDLDNLPVVQTHKLKWNNDFEEIKNIKCLHILEGEILVNILHASNLDLQKINYISGTNINIVKDNNSDRYFCCIKKYDIVNSSEIVEILKKLLFLSTNVVTIQVKPLSEYLTSAFVNGCVIRTICATKPKEKTLYPFLEQPNIITGVSAGAISLRQHLDLSATGYVCFLEYPNEFNTDGAFLKLLKYLNITLKQDRIMKQHNILDSNLYI